MKRLLPLLLLLPTLSACITTDKPLSVRKDSDEQILGVWKTNDEPNKPMEIDITSTDNGCYKFVQTEYTQDGKTKVATYPFSLTRTPKANYASVEIKEPRKGAKKSQSDADLEERYMIFRYSVNGRTLTVQNLGYEKLEAEVKAKRLKGQAWSTTWGNNARITEAPSSFLRKLDGPNGKAYFDKKIIFER